MPEIRKKASGNQVCRKVRIVTGIILGLGVVWLAAWGGFRPAKSPIHFEDATKGAGIEFSHFNAVRHSLLPEEIRKRPGNKLYRNQGDGTFVDVTEQAGVKQA